MSENRTIVDLSYIEEGYLGLIHPRSSGVLWNNQVGGTACGHPSLEGIFVPLPAVAPECEEDPLYDRYMKENSNQWREVRNFVQAFLETDGFLASWFEPLAGWHLVPDAQPRMVAEAWVPVRVRKSLNGEDNFYRGEFLLPLAGEVVVLTYPNSD